MIDLYKIESVTTKKDNKTENSEDFVMFNIFVIRIKALNLLILLIVCDDKKSNPKMRSLYQLAIDLY